LTLDRLHEVIKALRADLDEIDYAIRTVESIRDGKPVVGRPRTARTTALERSDSIWIPRHRNRKSVPKAKPKVSPADD
jgi:hypothetical protein